MLLKKECYKNIRSRMKPGDVIAFSGKKGFSEVIKWATRSEVSHVGVILQSKLLFNSESQPGFFNQIIESTSLNGLSGVTITRLSDRVNTYDGEMWWLPLSEASRKKLKLKKFFNFLIHQNHKPYDVPQAIKSGLDALDRIPIVGKATYNMEDFNQFFCSELAAAGLEKGKVINKINASEVTPIDLCRFKIYCNKYFQFKGKEEKRINGFNSVDPSGWGF